MRSMGSGSPMMPVEHTMTWVGRSFSAVAVSRAICFASSMPRGPVQALAFPLLATMARMLPRLMWLAETRTGAALTRFVVNVAAAAQGCSE